MSVKKENLVVILMKENKDNFEKRNIKTLKNTKQVMKVKQNLPLIV